MKLKEDCNYSQSGNTPKIYSNDSQTGTFELKSGNQTKVFKEYDPQYENKIDAEEREIVNYKNMFASMPQNETESQQEQQQNMQFAQ